MLTVGDKFPEFKLDANVSREKGKEFTETSSDDLSGKWLIFYAYPKDFTFICPTEIVEFGKRTKDFADRDAAARPTTSTRTWPGAMPTPIWPTCRRRSCTSRR